LFLLTGGLIFAPWQELGLGKIHFYPLKTIESLEGLNGEQCQM
jgi:hypothetical protein